jgi:hypothetical protein
MERQLLQKAVSLNKCKSSFNSSKNFLTFPQDDELQLEWSDDPDTEEEEEVPVSRLVFINTF